MTRRKLAMALTAALAAVRGFGQEQPYVSAKKMFYAEPVKDVKAGGKKPPARAGGGVHEVPVSYAIPGLHYTLLQEVEPGREEAVSPGKEFRSGDRVRFEFESNFDGYLYVTQEGSSGAWTVLFPDARINDGRNEVMKRRPYLVPSQPKYFVFNDVPGAEKLMVFLCKSPVSGLPSKADPAQRTVAQSIINELNSNLTSRDLVFEKDESAGTATVGTVPTASTYVVNPNKNGQAVVVTILLRHAR